MLAVPATTCDRPQVAVAPVRLAAIHLMAVVALVSKATSLAPCCTTPVAVAAVGPRALRRMPAARVVVVMVALVRTMMKAQLRLARKRPVVVVAVAAVTVLVRLAAAVLSLFVF